MSTALSSRRRIRVFTVGISAAVSLYFLAALVAEPLRAFALTETVWVEVTVNGEAIAFNCDGNNDGTVGSGETLSLGTITFYGDTEAYSDSRAARCSVYTGALDGYTVSWQVRTGKDGAFTGHLISQHEDIIRAFGTGSLHSPLFARTWFLNPENTQDDSRWGGRVSSNSAGSPPTSNLDFGTDGASEKWTRVATGSAVPIRTKAGPSDGGILGDVIRVGFRVQIGALRAQPTGTYRAEVTFTAALN